MGHLSFSWKEPDMSGSSFFLFNFQLKSPTSHRFAVGPDGLCWFLVAYVIIRTSKMKEQEEKSLVQLAHDGWWLWGRFAAPPSRTYAEKNSAPPPRTYMLWVFRMHFEDIIKSRNLRKKTELTGILRVTDFTKVSSLKKKSTTHTLTLKKRYVGMLYQSDDRGIRKNGNTKKDTTGSPVIN